MKGLSRIDSEKKNMHGWYVRAYGGGKTFSKYFSDKKHGGKEAARKKAIEYLKKLTEEVNEMFPYLTQRHTKAPPFWMKPGRNNSSGIVGVHKTEYWSPTRNHMVRCWVATWNEDGKRRDKAFYFSEHGRTEEEAKRLAIEFRAKKMKELAERYEYQKENFVNSRKRSRIKKAERSWVPGLIIEKFTPVIGNSVSDGKYHIIRKLEPFFPKHLEALQAVLGVVADLFDWKDVDFEFGRGLFKGDVRSRCFWNKEGIRTDVIVEDKGHIKVIQRLEPDPFYLEQRKKQKLKPGIKVENSE